MSAARGARDSHQGASSPPRTVAAAKAGPTLRVTPPQLRSRARSASGSELATDRRVSRRDARPSTGRTTVDVCYVHQSGCPTALRLGARMPYDRSVLSREGRPQPAQARRNLPPSSLDRASASQRFVGRTGVVAVRGSRGNQTAACERQRRAGLRPGCRICAVAATVPLASRCPTSRAIASPLAYDRGNRGGLSTTCAAGHRNA